MSGTVKLDVEGAAGLLRGMDDILIIMHKEPDGDALGSGFALWAGLLKLRKNARVTCSSRVHPMYCYMTDMYDGLYAAEPEFFHKYVVTVDSAAPSQLGSYEPLGKETDLSIDHHLSNSGYAKHTLLDADASSCAEVIYGVLAELGVRMDEYIASALYTGISSDTGCFRFRNTTVKSHLAAAELASCGADMANLNKILFETKSRGFIALQRAAIDSLEFYCRGKAAAVTLTAQMIETAGAAEEDVSGISQIPRSVEGVEAGLVFRLLKTGMIKCSVRTAGHIDASGICARFGGGGHRGAAGFECGGDMADVKAAVLAVVASELKKSGL